MMDEAEHDVLAFMRFPLPHWPIDKPFRCELLSWEGTGDRAAKSRVRGCKPGRAAFSVAPRLRRPCAASRCRVVAIG